jgi:hypothetical protein
VEDWTENRDEMMSVVLGPCGHRIELQARLEWAIPLRLVQARPVRAGVATSRARLRWGGMRLQR